jgi:hypothetical protein
VQQPGFEQAVEVGELGRGRLIERVRGWKVAGRLQAAG